MRGARALRAGFAVLCLAWAGGAFALGITYTTPLEAAYDSLLSSGVVPEALGRIGTQAPLDFEVRKRVAAMPAAKRGDYMLAALRRLELENAHADGAGNIVAGRFGLLHGPRLMVAARLDAPDKGRGLVALLAMLGTLQARRWQTVGDIVFVGVGSAGLAGALREAGPIDGLILIDGSASGEEGGVVTGTVLADAARRAAELMTAPAARLPARDSIAAAALSAGIPAMVMSDGGAGAAGAAYRPAGEWKGPQALLLASLALVGMGGVCDPQLAPVKAPALR